MKAHIVLAHPEPRSFNAQLAGATRNHLEASGYSATLSDLYEMDFDPREGPHHYPARKDADAFHPQTEQRFNAERGALPPDVEAEVERLLGCDLLVVHFPLWWFGPPAMLKGWMDRVFVYGQVYRSTMRYDAGACVGKRMIACVTTGASADNCAHDGREGDTRMHLWPVLYPFRYLGFDVCEPEVLHGVGATAFLEGHEGGLNGLVAYATRWADSLAALPSRPLLRYNRDTDFDEVTKRLLPEAPSHSPFIRRNGDGE